MLSSSAHAVTESAPAAPSHTPVVDARDKKPTPRKATESPDDFRSMLRETRIASDRLKADANALRVALTELRGFGGYLVQGYARLGDIVRLTEERSAASVCAVAAIEKRIEPLEILREQTLTVDDRLSALKALNDRVAQSAADFEARKHAIDVGREEASRVAELMEALRVRCASLIERANALGQAEAAVRQLEHRANETSTQLEQRANDFDARRGALETAAKQATAMLSRLEERVAALAKGEGSVAKSEAVVCRLERRVADAQRRLEQVERRKHDVERELDSARDQLRVLNESARTSVRMLRSANPSRHAWTQRLPFARVAAVAAALLALTWLGTLVQRTRDQSDHSASSPPTANMAAAVLPAASTTSPDAPSDAPIVRPAATTGTITTRAFSVDGRSPARTARNTQTDASRPERSADPSFQQYFGHLALDSEPRGSVVFVDREEVGRTPLSLTRIRAGSHVVRIEQAGYDRWTSAVVVTADRQTRVRAKMQAAR